MCFCFYLDFKLRLEAHEDCISHHPKVDVPNSVAELNQTSISGWYLVRCSSKNGYQKDMCLKGIGLCAQNMITILGPIVNILGGTYVTI